MKHLKPENIKELTIEPYSFGQENTVCLIYDVPERKEYYDILGHKGEGENRYVLLKWEYDGPDDSTCVLDEYFLTFELALGRLIELEGVE